MVKLSKHAADEMAGRAILLSYIEAALASPDRVVQDMTDPALSAGDPDDHLVEMPAIARPRTAAPQPACDNRPEFQHPAAHRLVRDIEPALGDKLLHIAVAQGKPEDDDRGKRWPR